MDKSSILEIARVLGSAHTDAGDNILIQCPFARWKHKKGTDSKPSFSIKVSANARSPYYCFGCEAKGGSLTTAILQLDSLGLEKSTVVRLLEIAAVEDGAVATRSITADEIMMPKESFSLLMSPPPSITRYDDADFRASFPAWYGPYLHRRGITPETALLYEAGYDARYERVVFPVRWYDGTLVGAVGRSCGKAEPKYYNYFRFKKGTVLFGEHLLTPDPVVVCEGPFDAIKVRQAGFNSVAVLGAKFTQIQVNKLVETRQPVVVLFDPDETGYTQGENLVAELRARGVETRLLFPPEGYDAGGLSSAAIRDMLSTLFVRQVVTFPSYWG